MAFVTADVVSTPGAETPFKVVFKQGETVLVEWEVGSQQEGEQQILECIKGIAEDDDEDSGNHVDSNDDSADDVLKDIVQPPDVVKGDDPTVGKTTERHDGS